MAIRPEELEVPDTDDKIKADALEKRIDAAIKNHVRRQGLQGTMKINLGSECMPNCIVKAELMKRYRAAGWNLGGFEYQSYGCYDRNTELKMTITKI